MLTDQIFMFFLAILPILVIFIGLVFLRVSGTLMAVIGWVMTVGLSIIFFRTPPDVAFFASFCGILSSFGISLMVLFTILQVTMMDVTGAIRSISSYIRKIAAERYEQIMILNVGLGTFLVSIGATPVTMLPPIMIALGYSPLAAVALPCLGYDTLTSFSLLAVPITLPSSVFGLDVSILGGTITFFLPVISTGFALGMLWLADGFHGVRKGLVPALVAGLTLGFSCILFVRILPPSAIGLTGVFSGLVTMGVLLLMRVLGGKPILARTVSSEGEKETSSEKLMPLVRATLPWLLLVMFCILISIPVIQSSLSLLPGDIQKVPLIANKSVDLKPLNQAYFWVLVSTLLSAPFLVRDKAQAKTILATWARRAWSPTLAAAVFFAIAYVMDWSGQSVLHNSLGFLPGNAAFNMNAVIGLTLAMIFGVAFPVISPTLGLFGAFVSGSETSSNVMFYGILKKATDVLNLDFTKVYAGHAVAGGIASGIAPAKIINAAAVIDCLGIEGEVIRKTAVVAIPLTLLTGVMLVLLLSL